MSNKRRNFTEAEKIYLHNEVDGYCPICGEKLTHKKGKVVTKSFQIAHIFPLNPVQEEINELFGVEKIFDDINDLENLLAVCPNCHGKFDKPRTKDEYNNWVAIKKKLLKSNSAEDNYYLFHVEEELREILKVLDIQQLDMSDDKLSLDLLELDDKLDLTIKPITKREIHNNVVDYFVFLQDRFKEINLVNPNKFETLASQIKSFYLKCSQTNNNQEDIYNLIVGWLNSKTQSISPRACQIIVSFFIQDCEVFSNVIS